MVIFLRIWFLWGSCSMAYAAVQTSLQEGWGIAETLMDYWWFNATLLDVYLGLAMFSFWVIYKGSDASFPWLRGLLWTLFFVVTGNIGTAIYMLILLLQIPANTTGLNLAKKIFLSRSHAEKCS